MQPVVPRIRVGDVLRGTKHLRNWLQTKSLVAYALKADAKVLSPSDQLYVPRKDSQFVVVVNAWETFIACDFSDEVGVAFCNTLPPSSKRDLVDIRMSPSIFATWFIRTKERQPDLREWPAWAYVLWAALQMNLCSKQLAYSIPALPEGPFSIAKRNGRADPDFRRGLKRFLRDHAPQGVTRQRIRSRRVLRSAPYGPRLEDLAKDRQAVQEITNNSRLMQQMKEQLAPKIFDVILKEMKHQYGEL